MINYAHVVVLLLIHRKQIAAVFSLPGKILDVLGILMVVIKKSKEQTSIKKYWQLEIEFGNLCTAMTQLLHRPLVNALKTMNFS